MRSKAEEEVIAAPWATTTTQEIAALAPRSRYAGVARHPLVFRPGKRGRAAECTRLESGRRETVRGFESLRFRAGRRMPTESVGRGAPVCFLGAMPPAPWQRWATLAHGKRGPWRSSVFSGGNAPSPLAALGDACPRKAWAVALQCVLWGRSPHAPPRGASPPGPTCQVTFAVLVPRPGAKDRSVVGGNLSNFFLTSEECGLREPGDWGRRMIGGTQPIRI
jgi:hypothetical protein